MTVMDVTARKADSSSSGLLNMDIDAGGAAAGRGGGGGWARRGGLFRRRGTNTGWRRWGRRSTSSGGTGRQVRHDSDTDSETP